MEKKNIFIAATNNIKKLAELKEILAGLGIEVLSQRQAGIFCEPDENGADFEENAYIKAAAVSEASGLPAVADDSGLCVDALGGAPGVYSARYGGPGLDDEGRYKLLLEKMNGVPPEKRGAAFVSAVCVVYPDGRVVSARGECRGRILEGPSGSGGFGYDPVFSAEGGLDFGRISQEEKNRISHRGAALSALVKKLLEEPL